jgi:hypothetical protein
VYACRRFERAEAELSLFDPRRESPGGKAALRSDDTLELRQADDHR